MGVLQLTRTVTDRKTKRKHTETVYAVTTLSVTDATPAATAGWLRGHWAIENRLHWVRDVTYAQDHSHIRNGPKSWPPSATPPSVSSDSTATTTPQRPCTTTPAALTNPSNYC